MNMFKWFTKCVQHSYTDFTGRASRAEYWSFSFVNILIILALALLGKFIGDSFNASVIGLFVIVLLGLAIPSISVSVRRLHDIGFSGWWLLLSLIPLGGLVIFVLSVLPSEFRENAWGVTDDLDDYYE